MAEGSVDTGEGVGGRGGGETRQDVTCGVWEDKIHYPWGPRVAGQWVKSGRLPGIKSPPATVKA